MTAKQDETEAVARPPAGPVAPPERLGRYVILDTLGAGGMGAVYDAWDRELERRVALKVLHPGGEPDRFVREAQLLAKLKHPNVVTVYDVGRSGDEVFIAMELVEGRPLRGWLETPHTWRDVLAVFRAAGRGLAAAHDAGLVHRDFKPDNVLVGADGHVRVVDFGLARPIGESVAEVVPLNLSPSGLSGRMTLTGAVMGTPRYMAPEQKHGDVADERADQYSFAVALWEGLYGEHPVRRDHRVPAARGKAPARLRRALERALQARPGDRWPTMHRLLAELAHDPAHRRRFVAVAAVAAAAAAVTAVSLFTYVNNPRPCSGLEAGLAGIWDAPVRATASASFLATGRSYAADTFERTALALDGYARRWVGLRRDVCLATAVRKEQSPALMDLRMRCLDRRAHELGALAALFTRANNQILDNAISAAQRLEDLSSCSDLDALRTALPLPEDPVVRAGIADLRGRIDQAAAFDLAGQPDASLKIMEPVVVEADATGYAPVRAEARIRLGHALWVRDPARDEKVMQQAVAIAGEAKDDRLLARALIDLGSAILYQGARADEALGLLRAAEALVARVDDPALRAELLAQQGKALEVGGHVGDALPVLYRAAALFHDAEDKDPRHAASLVTLGNALRKAGRNDEARAMLLEAQTIFTRAYGPSHPFVAGTLLSLGNLARDQGRLEEAVGLFERALVMQESRLGPEHIDVARSLTNLGTCLKDLGRLDEAERVIGRSLELKQKLLPPGHPLLGSSMLILGQIQHQRGRDDEAWRTLADTLALRQRAGAESLGVAEVYDVEAAFRRDQGRCVDALPLYQRALAIQEKVGAAVDAAASREGIAACATAPGRLPAAATRSTPRPSAPSSTPSGR